MSSVVETSKTRAVRILRLLIIAVVRSSCGMLYLSYVADTVSARITIQRLHDSKLFTVTLTRYKR